MIASTGPACEGGEIVLSVPSYGGSSVSYEWSHNGNLLSGITGVTGERTNELVINPVSSTHVGDYTVAIVVDGCELDSDTYDLEVFDQPTALANATSSDICEGGELSLTANSTNATTFSWTGPNGFSSNAENPVISNVTVANNGGYTVEVTSANGCKAVSSVVVTNILPGVETPNITTNSPVCEDENIVLNILQSYNGSVSYTWTNGAGTNIGSGSSVTIGANAADAISPYVVQVTVDGCTCLLYTSPSPRDRTRSRMPSSA